MASTPVLPEEAKRLKGKVSLITGGASGIGECTAKLFIEHGAKVVIADIQDELGASVCAALGPNAVYVHCDVTDEAQIKNAVDKAVSTYGKLDIMFNNAGISGEYKLRITDSEKADFERVLSTNVTGVFLGIKHAASVMIPARSGNIITTASTASILGGQSIYAYCASKHAVVGLTKNAAAELGKFGVRVNCVSPFGVATPMAMTALGLGAEEIETTFESVANLKGVKLRSEDVASAVLYLASDEAKYVSGHNLMIDGGFSTANAAYSPPESGFIRLCRNIVTIVIME